MRFSTPMFDEQTDSEPEPLGAQLKALREARGLSLDDVAQATNVPIDKLEAIEAGTITGTTPTTYARGFVRIYAEHVEADVETVMDAFDRSCHPHRAKLYLRGLGPLVHKDYRPSRRRGRRRAGARATSWALLALLVLVGAYYVYKNFDALLGLTEEEPTNTTSTAVIPETTQPIEAEAAPAATTEPRYKLLIVAEENAWIRVQQDGTLVKAWEVLGKGEQFPAVGVHQVKVTLRDPSRVRVHVDGQPLTEELGSSPVTLVYDAQGLQIEHEDE